MQYRGAGARNDMHSAIQSSTHSHDDWSMSVLKYLTYTHRVAISNHRLLASD